MAADIVHGKGMCTALKRVAYSFIEARLAKLTTIIICVSDGLRQKHLQRGVPEDKLTVIHNSTVLPDGVTEDAKASARTDLGVDADAKVVGTVARLCPGKGIDCLMKAAVEVCRKRPEAVFLVAGDGDLRPDFELAAENLGLGDRFRFLGFREDVHKVFLASDVFSLPSWGEGHPLSVLEAMAFARPVVATRVAGIVEAVTDGVTGLLVPRDGAADLAEAVLRLLDSPDDAGEMGRMGRIKVEAEFSIARTLEATRAVYRRAMASG
jgi:glycosyltransferase involved in cell wall biosynthesis